MTNPDLFGPCLCIMLMLDEIRLEGALPSQLQYTGDSHDGKMLANEYRILNACSKAVGFHVVHRGKA